MSMLNKWYAVEMNVIKDLTYEEMYLPLKELVCLLQQNITRGMDCSSVITWERPQMPHVLLLHLPRSEPDRHAILATQALKPAHNFINFKIVRVPSHVLPTAMQDTESDDALCAWTAEPLSEAVIKSLRWAVHKRFANVSQTHAQLRCDLTGGDESRIKRKPARKKNHH